MRAALIVIFIAVLVGLYGCDRENGDAGIQQAYRQGVNDTVNRLQQESTKMRESMRKEVARRMLWLSVVFILLTLFGAEIAEKVRCWLRRKIPAAAIRQLVKMTYVAMLVLTLAATVKYGISPLESLPLWLVMVASYGPYLQYLSALDDNDPTAAKNSLSKLKSLAFFALVTVIIYHLLSSGSIANSRQGFWARYFFSGIASPAAGKMPLIRQSQLPCKCLMTNTFDFLDQRIPPAGLRPSTARFDIPPRGFFH